MKNKFMMTVVGMLMVCLLPIAADDQTTMTTTSTMQLSGSAYSPQVTPVGASSVESGLPGDETSNYTGSRKARKSFEPNQEMEEQDTGSPIGDAALPLMLFAAAAAATVAIRNRRRQMAE